MKVITLFLFLIVLQCAGIKANSPSNQKTGKVVVSVISGTYAFNDEFVLEQLLSKGHGTLVDSIIEAITFDTVDGKPVKFGILLKGDNYLQEFSHKDRTVKSDKNGKKFFVDKYEIIALPGLYGLLFNGGYDYKSANFLLKHGEEVNFTITSPGFFQKYCQENSRYIGYAVEDLTITISHSPSSYSGPLSKAKSITKLQTDRISLVHPFSTVINYCKKKAIGKSVRYTNAEVRYKNYNIFANKVIIDKKKLILKAIGNKKSPVRVIINGNRFEVMELKIDLEERKIEELRPV